MPSERHRVFLDINIGTESAGRLTIELFSDKTPKTCENFRTLCTGSHESLTYARSPFHRIIDEFMVQGGDITKGDGTGGTSIYGGEFEDENLSWRELDSAGLLCMANRGKGTNSSQFFITLEACPHLNGKHTVFGHLVSGHETLNRMAKVDVDDDDRPKEPVLIARCGELERRKKPTARPPTSAASESESRGRAQNRHRSPTRSSSDSRSITPPPRSARKHRRESDLKAADETLRGRAKRRSESGSRSANAVSDSPAVKESRLSPPYKSRRKRSPSPSRGVASAKDADRHKGSGGDEREPARHRRDDWDPKRDYRDRDDHRRDRDDHRSRRDKQYPKQRRQDDRHGRLDEGRLGGDPFDDDNDDGNTKIQYKGRGSMKFREPDRRW